MTNDEFRNALASLRIVHDGSGTALIVIDDFGKEVPEAALTPVQKEALDRYRKTYWKRP